MSNFFLVFDKVGITYALASGFLAGSTVVLWASLKFPLLNKLSTVRMALLVAMAGMVLGGIFFTGQISQAYLTDPLWLRALARATLWMLFSIATGAGLGFARSFAHRRELKK